VVRPPLSQAAAELWASIVALTEDSLFSPDNLPKLPTRSPPAVAAHASVAPVSGAQSTQALASVTRAGDRRGDDVYSIGGRGRFRTATIPAYGSRGFDEAAWETIRVPQRWDEAGHRITWVRVVPHEVPAPEQGDGKADRRNLFLEIGKIADADETFVNGVRVGQTGELSQSGRGDPQAYRRYRVPPETLNWGGENVVAVRVLGSGGIGV